MTPTNEDLLALAKIICAAMNGPSEYGWDDQSDLYRSRCLDAARCDLVAERKSTQLCASHDCGRPAMVRFESGGVGSTYCMECYLKIQELFDRTPDARVAVFPIYDIAGCHHIRDAERQGDQSAPLVDYGDAVAANDRLTESARKGLAAKIAASEPPAHDHQRDLVTADRRQAIRDQALDAILADDELCLRLAEGYDREDAAQRGEPNPHSMGEDGYSEWALGRVSCAKEGLRAAIRAMKGTTE